MQFTMAGRSAAQGYAAVVAMAACEALQITGVSGATNPASSLIHDSDYSKSTEGHSLSDAASC